MQSPVFGAANVRSPIWPKKTLLPALLPLSLLGNPESSPLSHGQDILCRKLTHTFTYTAPWLSRDHTHKHTSPPLTLIPKHSDGFSPDRSSVRPACAQKKNAAQHETELMLSLPETTTPITDQFDSTSLYDQSKARTSSTNIYPHRKNAALGPKHAYVAEEINKG